MHNIGDTKPKFSNSLWGGKQIGLCIVSIDFSPAFMSNGLRKICIIFLGSLFNILSWNQTLAWLAVGAHLVYWNFPKSVCICMYVCVCLNICLSLCTHVSKTLLAKSSLFMRIEGYRVQAGQLWVILQYGWSELIRLSPTIK